MSKTDFVLRQTRKEPMNKAKMVWIMNNGRVHRINANRSLLKFLFEELRSDPSVLAAAVQIRRGLYFNRDRQRVSEIWKPKNG